MNWCRLWHDLPNDPKFRTIARVSQQSTANVISVFIHLMVDASANATERGRTQPNAEDLASALDLRTEQVETILAAMEGRVLLSGRLTGWEKRQPKREDGGAERAKQWRESHKLKGLSKLERERTQANANEHKRSPDGDETETRRDEVVSVVTEVLSKPEDSNERKNGTVKPNGFGHSKSNGAVSSNSSVADPARLKKIGVMIHDYLGATAMPTERKVKPPDPAIILKCSLAIGDVPLDRVSELLQRLWKDQAPHMPNGPKKYAWFVPVFTEHFGGHT